MSPIFEYQCSQHHVTERILQRDLQVIGCPTCGRPAVRVPSVCHSQAGSGSKGSETSQAIDRVRRAIATGRA